MVEDGRPVRQERRKAEGGPVRQQQLTPAAGQRPAGLQQGLQRANPVANIREALPAFGHVVG